MFVDHKSNHRLTLVSNDWKRVILGRWFNISDFVLIQFSLKWVKLLKYIRKFAAKTRNSSIDIRIGLHVHWVKIELRRAKVCRISIKPKIVLIWIKFVCASEIQCGRKGSLRKKIIYIWYQFVFVALMRFESNEIRASETERVTVSRAFACFIEWLKQRYCHHCSALLQL